MHGDSPAARDSVVGRGLLKTILLAVGGLPTFSLSFHPSKINMSQFPRVASLKTTDDLRKHCQTLGLSMPIDDTVDVAALGSSIELPSDMKHAPIGNRFFDLTDGRMGW